jgi:tetratricopeptide (TPR) repeat protein
MNEFSLILDKLKRSSNPDDTASLLLSALEYEELLENDLKASLYLSLGNTYWQCSGDTAANNKLALRSFEKCLLSNPTDSLIISRCLNDTAMGICRDSQSMTHETLDSILSLLRRSMQECNKEMFPVDWARPASNFAATLASYLELPTASEIDEGLRLGELALSIRRSYGTVIQIGLTLEAIATLSLRRSIGDLTENVAKALEYVAELESLPVKPPGYRDVCLLVADTLFTSDEVMPRSLFDSVVQLYNWALCGSDDNALKARVATSLASAYHNWSGFDSSFNQRAIDYAEGAMENARDSSPRASADLLRVLASCYTARISGDRGENVEHAIRLYNGALRNVQSDDELYALILSVLAQTYTLRLHGTSDENYELAEKYAYEACALAQVGSENQAIAQAVLGQILSEREIISEGDLRLAIKQLESSIKKFPPNQLLSHRWCANSALGKAYLRLGSFAGSDEPLFAQAALQLMLDCASEPFVIDQPIYYCRTLVVMAESCRRLGDYVQASSYCSQAMTVGASLGTDVLLIEAATLQGNIHMATGSWNQALDAFESAICAFEAMSTSLARQQDMDSALISVAEIYSDAAYAAAKTERPDRAIELMEQGRVRTMRRSFRLPRTLIRLAASSPDRPASSFTKLAREYAQAIRHSLDLGWLDRMTSDDASNNDTHFVSLRMRKAAEQAREHIEGLENQIRRLPGMADEFNPLTSSEIHEYSGVLGKPIVMVTATNFGGMAMVVRPGGIATIWLPSLTRAAALSQLVGDESSPGFLRVSFDDFERSSMSLEETLVWLGSEVMKPIINALSERSPSIILIPMGLLTLAPLQAAILDTSPRMYALDAVVITIGVSVEGAMLAACNGRHEFRSLLGVHSPLTRRRSVHEWAELEVELIAPFFQEVTVYQDAEATSDRVLSALGSFDVTHFACHAITTNIFSTSGIALAGDEPICIANLLTNASTEKGFAFLSACETAVPSGILSDEVFGLPMALIATGFWCVVGSMWPIGDVSSALLAHRFYFNWFHGSGTPEDALRHAQQWIRDTTNGEKIDYFKGFETSSAARKTCAHLQGYPANDRTFEHPRFWAAFSVAGC